MPKRGQITIFVIIGIVILAIISATFYILNQSRINVNEETETMQLPIQLQQEKNKIEQCFAEVLEEGALILGKNGGYIYNKPENTINYNNNEIAFIGSIDKKRIENELKEYVLNELARCNEGQKIKDAAIKIEPEKILLEAVMPTILSVGDSSAEISHFESETELELGNMLAIIDEIKNDRDCASCLMDLMNNYKMTAEINLVDKGKIFVIKNENYEMEFATD